MAMLGHRCDGTIELDGPVRVLGCERFDSFVTAVRYGEKRRKLLVVLRGQDRLDVGLAWLGRGLLGRTYVVLVALAIDFQSRGLRQRLSWGGCLLANLPVGLLDHAENAAPKNLGLTLEARALDVALGNIELLAGDIGHCRVLPRVLSRPTTGQPHDDHQRSDEAKRAHPYTPI